MSKALTISESEALAYLYGGGDEEIVCHSEVWVMTRYPHPCLSPVHQGEIIPAGTRMVLERARIDGQFGSCYTCTACMKRAEKEIATR